FDQCGGMTLAVGAGKFAARYPAPPLIAALPPWVATGPGPGMPAVALGRCAYRGFRSRVDNRLPSHKLDGRSGQNDIERPPPDFGGFNQARSPRQIDPFV